MKFLPSWKNAALALASAGLLILAFPDFEWWFLAWFALVPLMWAVERETTLQKPARSKSILRGFLLGWLFGTAFFFGTCWWLTYALIHYAAVPWPLAYLLIFIVCTISGIFPGIFAAILSVLIRRFGAWVFLAAPFIWVFTEFARFWITGTNWNAIGYSQAGSFLNWYASFGGVLLTSFTVIVFNVVGFRSFEAIIQTGDLRTVAKHSLEAVFFILISFLFSSGDSAGSINIHSNLDNPTASAWIAALQPNVPMSGVDYSKLKELRQRQFDLAEAEIKKLITDHRPPTTVILPESPMNFMYNDDREFQQFIGNFARRNNVSVLFNSAEPDATNGKYFNSAVMVGPDGREVAQYDKIYLLPFGEAVPVPLESVVPAFVGNFSYGREYDLLPLGDAKAGVMICFESHFGQLSREYVRNGADALIEMTNDGYLGPTPVLRQHLANAVFRAVETNRPVIRVTNVGITAYIDERGQVHDPLPSYTEGTRVWTVEKSDGAQTFYVKYGDWFAWLCTVITLMMLGYAFFRRRQQTV